MESSIVKVDTQLITQLCGEIDRLTKEVSRLDSVQKTSRDQKLSDLRQADQMSTAFRPDHSSQRNLVKALEERLLDYKCKAEKTKQELATLRERFLKETLSRHKLSQELARQRAVTQRLSEELEAADKCYVADSPKISTPRLEDKENLPLDESALNVNKCAQLVSSSDSREVECKQS
ncbi:unnamed protein product [Mesocestoides corti]|nr:unnamed protein product [Mesocestoides corti]